VRLQQQMQRLDDLTQRLASAARTALHRGGERLAQRRARLLQRSPAPGLAESHARTRDLAARLAHAVRQRLAGIGSRLALAARALDGLSPLATLTRGFAIVTRPDGTVLRDAAAVRSGDAIEARLARGTLTARVTGRK